ncbi:MAG: hypothetical protein QOE27_2150 [Solirubrobacteraceae bacterium]|nr:hypothetical protein [Solirubrobacteraceae bacterium]
MNEPGRQPTDHDCSGDAAAYVLGALNDQEVNPFLRHLESCAICRDEVNSLQVVADMLPASVSPVTAPRGLRRRVLATVYEEAELFRAAAPAPPAPAPALRWRLPWRPAAGPPARRRPVSRGFQGLAAACLVGVGIVVGTIALGGSGGSSDSRGRVVLADATPPTTAVLRLGSAGRTELAVSNLAPAPNGRVYEVWLQRKGEPKPTDALFTPTADGRATVAVPGDLSHVDAVLVTDEPAGGSSAPTRTPLIRASLQ